MKPFNKATMDCFSGDNHATMHTCTDHVQLYGEIPIGIGIMAFDPKLRESRSE